MLDSHQSGNNHSNQYSPPSANDEAQLLLRARCAELELRLAKQAELIADLKSSSNINHHGYSNSVSRSGGNNNHRNSSLDAAGGKNNNNSTADGSNNNNNDQQNQSGQKGNVRDLFTIQRENGMFVEKNKSLESKLQIAQDSLSALQNNLAREVQRAREEGERHAQQLRQQLIEAQEHATSLQEKIVGLLGKDAAVRNAGLEDLMTENIFITTDAVLHRLQTDRRLVGQSARAKYDVATEFRGRTLVLTGKRLNVLQLKSEILTMLNECYSNLAGDPTQRVEALRSKDSATKAELDHLRRTIATQEQTVSSLHTALHTANEKAARAVAESEVEKRDARVAVEKANGQVRLWETEKLKLQRQVEQMQLQLNDAGNIQSMSMQSLQKEVHLSLEVRDELDRTRLALENALAAKETAERMAFAATSQVQSKDGAMESLLQRSTKAEAAAQRVGHLEHDLQRAESRINALQEEIADLRSNSAEERGRTRERTMRNDNEVILLQNQLEEVSEQKYRLEQDLRRMEEAANNWENFVTVVGRSAVNNAGSPQELVALTSSASTRVARLEEENTKLREELQRAFEDMKTVATALRDTKTARENTLQLCDKLEMEKLRLIEEKKQLNDDLIAQRMQGKTREGESTMRIQQLQHEVAYQKSRVDTIHQEYQRRIASATNNPQSSAAAVAMGGGNSLTSGDAPVRSGSTSSQQQQQMNNNYNNNVENSSNHSSRHQQQQQQIAPLNVPGVTGGGNNSGGSERGSVHSTPAAAAVQPTIGSNRQSRSESVASKSSQQVQNQL